jgi:hypothetical protein
VANSASCPEPLVIEGAALRFPFYRQIGKAVQRGIMLKQMAESDVMRFIRVGVIRAATQELPIAVLTNN